MTLLEAYQSFDDDAIDTISKVTNNEWSRLDETSKDDGAHLSSSDLCDPLYSPLVIFFNVVEFILLRFFNNPGYVIFKVLICPQLTTNTCPQSSRGQPWIITCEKRTQHDECKRKELQATF